jgi:hypothetical protein
VPKQFFDVVVLGRSLGALLLGALLGRRGMRVLVLGDGARDAGYQVLDTALLRRNFRLYTSPLPSFGRFFFRDCAAAIVAAKACRFRAHVSGA